MKKESRPSRKKTQHTQKELARQRRLSVLEQFLSEDQHNRPHVVILANGEIHIAGNEPTAPEHEYVVKGLGRTESLLMNDFIGRDLARQRGAESIYTAKAEVEEVYRRARDEALDGVEHDDYAPLAQHLAVLGFRLLEDPLLLDAVDEMWYRAQHGEKASAQTLNLILRALSVRRGRLTEHSLEHQREARAKSNRQSSTRRNNRAAAQRLVKKVNQQEAWYLKKGRNPQQAPRDAIHFVTRHFQATSRATNKPAILAIFEDILHND